jgi:hypothetical protein
LKSAERQSVGRQRGAVVLRATCSAACRIELSGAVKAGKRRTPLRRVERSLPALRAVRIRLRLPAARLGAVRRALRAHQKVTVGLIVVVRSASGGTGRTVRRTIVLRT